MRKNYYLHGISELDGAPRSDIGPVAQYLADVYELRPEVVRTEQLDFLVTITNGVIVSQTGSQRIDPEFAFALRRISGWGSVASGTEQWAPEVLFNVSDQGRARGGIFRDPIRMSSIVDSLSGSPALEKVWDSFYTFVAGADIAVEWSIRTAANLPQAATIECGISITGDVIRTRRLPGGAMVVSDGRGNARG